MQQPNLKTIYGKSCNTVQSYSKQNSNSLQWPLKVYIICFSFFSNLITLLLTHCTLSKCTYVLFFKHSKHGLRSLDLPSYLLMCSSHCNGHTFPFYSSLFLNTTFSLWPHLPWLPKTFSFHNSFYHIPCFTLFHNIFHSSTRITSGLRKIANGAPGWHSG